MDTGTHDRRRPRSAGHLLSNRHRRIAVEQRSGASHPIQFIIKRSSTSPTPRHFHAPGALLSHSFGTRHKRRNQRDHARSRLKRRRGKKPFGRPRLSATRLSGLPADSLRKVRCLRLGVSSNFLNTACLTTRPHNTTVLLFYYSQHCDDLSHRREQRHPDL